MYIGGVLWLQAPHIQDKKDRSAVHKQALFIKGLARLRRGWVVPNQDLRGCRCLESG